MIVEAAKTDAGATVAMMRVTAEVFSAEDPWPEWRPDLVVACPSTSAPGFPRAMLMADAVAEVLACPPADILVKTPGAARRSSQLGKSYPSTFSDLCQEGHSKCIGKLIGGERVLLVDDLMTQGATAAAAAAGLRGAGAADVRLLTFAQYTTTTHLEGYCD